MLQKGDTKLINAWAFYDWANSVYSLVIATAVFPIFYEAVTEGEKVRFLGMDWNNTTIYSYALGFSFLVVAFLSPILSAVADYTGNKKRFMQFFCLLGSVSVMMLYFFTGIDTAWIGLTFTILASIGFWGSIVFYNAYLPEVAAPEDHDRVSARGFMTGYTGSVILLLLILAMMMMPHWFGFVDAPLKEGENAPVKVFQFAFVLVGIWWLGFAQFTFKRLPNNPFKRKPEKDYIFKGYRELRTVLNEIKKQRELKILLIAFFLYSVGVQTVIMLASIFGIKDLGLETSNLIITILLIQIVGVLGAFVFSKLSKKIGNIKALKITTLIWSLICVSAYFFHREDPNLYFKFYILGGFIGLVLGAIQALSRSTYSKLIPENTQDNATYFSFYDVTEKIAIVFGMTLAGIVTSFTDSLRLFILLLSVFFIAGFIALSFMKKTKHVQ